MLVFTGIAAVVVVAAAVGMLILIEQAVWGPLDAAIEEEAETLARIRNIAPVEDLQRAVANVGSEAAPGPGKLIRVTAAGGETVVGEGTQELYPQWVGDSEGGQEREVSGD